MPDPTARKRLPSTGLLLFAVACSDTEAPRAAADAAPAGELAAAPDASTCASHDVFVAPAGEGTACSCSAPCALEAGRDRARALLSAGGSDVVVDVADGVYRLARTFTLDPSISGAPGHATIFKAAPGASPVWSGAIHVDGFRRVDDLVWVADVPPGTASRQLFVNGRRATRARGPALPAGYTPTETGFTLGDSTIAGWPDKAGLEVVGSWEWQHYRCPVTSVDAATGISVAPTCWANVKSHFETVGWLENARELLDAPGEFFLDSPNGKLYYGPRQGEDLGAADVELPILESLVSAAGTPSEPVHDVAFEGITFAHATWLDPSGSDGYASIQASFTNRGVPAVATKPLANVTMHATHAVRFSACTFAHLGGTGLAFEVGAQENLVDGCRFEDISGSAVMVGDVTHGADHHPSSPDLLVRDNTVRSSYVTRAGAEYLDACGIFVGYTTHTTVASNELFDLPYTGISVGWGWGGVDPGGSGGYTTPTPSKDNVIEKNVVSHHLRALRDGAGIYVLGAQPGSSMKGNVVANQGGPFGNLYLDNGSQYWTLEDNVVFVSPKQNVPSPDPDRSYWLYVQVLPLPILAKNNKVTRSFTNDATNFVPSPVDPSNTVDPPTVFEGLATGNPILAAAGTPLRSPEVAAGKPATASSEWSAEYRASNANDANAFDGWSSASTDAHPWWQVDLGASVAIDAVEVVSRWAIDQPETRRSYRVIASSDPTFAVFAVLATVDATGLAHRAILAAAVSPPVTARYVRVEKTASEYLFLGDVRVHGK